MASAVVEAFLGISGLTQTVDLYPLGSDTAGASGITMTEATNRKGLYTGTTTAALTGEHQAFMKSGSTVVGLGYVVMSDDTAVHRVVDNADVFDKAGTSTNVGGISGTLQTAADIGSLATEINADVDEIIVTLGVGGAGLTGLPAVTLTGDLTATMKTSVQTAADAAITANATIIEIESETDAIAALPSAASIFTSVVTTQMTESYRAAGVAPTLAQAVFEIIAGILDHSTAGTTKSIRNIAGSTAKTYTLNDAVSPTSITETT